MSLNRTMRLRQHISVEVDITQARYLHCRTNHKVTITMTKNLLPKKGEVPTLVMLSCYNSISVEKEHKTRYH